MSPNFSLLQEKVRTGKKTLTYRQLYVPQVEVGSTEPLWDSKNKRKVKRKSGKGFKEVNTLLAYGKITHVYFRFKKYLTLEECCVEQGREIPKMPVLHRDLFSVYQDYTYQELLELRGRLDEYSKDIPEVKNARFAIEWEIESCLVIIKKSWRMLTKINGGDKPNGVIIRWDWLGEHKATSPDIRKFLKN